MRLFALKLKNINPEEDLLVPHFVTWIQIKLLSVMVMGALQHGPGGPWPTQNFGWVSHNAFGTTNNWHVCSLVKLV